MCEGGGAKGGGSAGLQSGMAGVQPTVPVLIIKKKYSSSPIDTQ